MRRSALVVAVVLALTSCWIAAGCGSLDSGSTTTVVGGGAPTGDTLDTTVTTLSDGETAPTVGGTPMPGASGGTLLGRWHNAISGDVIEFLSDGTILGTYADRAGATVYYTVSGDQLSLSVSTDAGEFFVLQATFSVDGDTLTVVDAETGESGTFQRVE